MYFLLAIENIYHWCFIGSRSYFERPDFDISLDFLVGEFVTDKTLGIVDGVGVVTGLLGEDGLTEESVAGFDLCEVGRSGSSTLRVLN